MRKLFLFSMVFILALSSRAQDTKLVGLSLAYLRDRWYTDLQFIEQNVKELGASLSLKYANGDVESQQKQIQELIAEGVKVIIIVPVDGEALKTSIEACKKANIKVIAYDRLIKNCDLDYYITFNNHKVGELQAGYVANKLGKGNFILIGGPIKDLNSLGFMKGQKDALDPYIKEGTIKIILEKNLQEWDQMESFMEISPLVEAGIQIDAVIASNDEIASGAIMAFEGNENYKNVMITGQDASLESCRSIVKGKLILTIYKPVSQLAKITVKLAIDLINGKNTDAITNVTDNGFKQVPTILLEPQLVDKSNIDEIIIKTGVYKNDEVYSPQ